MALRYVKQYEQERRRSDVSKLGFYLSSGWRDKRTGARTVLLAMQPLCASCLKVGKLTPAQEVDHIRPLKLEHFIDGTATVSPAYHWLAYGISVEFSDKYGNIPVYIEGKSNLQGLCRACHRSKSSGVGKRSEDNLAKGLEIKRKLEE